MAPIESRICTTHSVIVPWQILEVEYGEFNNGSGNDYDPGGGCVQAAATISTTYPKTL